MLGQEVCLRTKSGISSWWVAVTVGSRCFKSARICRVGDIGIVGTQGITKAMQDESELMGWLIT